MIRIAINGYGRIGRVAHRVILEKHNQEIEVVGINAGSSTDLKGWMYLLKYDSVYGHLPYDISAKEAPEGSPEDLLGFLIINQKEIPLYSQKDPEKLPWGKLNVDVVIESTGKFRTKELLIKHIQSGAKKVILSAPAKGDDMHTFVLGVNEDSFSGEDVISNASCTTNCISPVAKIMQEVFGVEKAMMTTVHGYTSDQRLHDGGHDDYRRARAAGINIVPTSTGATEAMSKAVPALEGKFKGLSLRVPVPVGSLSDFTFLLSRSTTKEEINEVMRKMAQEPRFRGILEVSDDPLVSTDIIGNPHSAIVDLGLTQVVGGTMVKVVAWYDNEYGYANRLVEEVLMIA